jgi:hypothetical protein
MPNEAQERQRSPDGSQASAWMPRVSAVDLQSEPWELFSRSARYSLLRGFQPHHDSRYHCYLVSNCFEMLENSVAPPLLAKNLSSRPQLRTPSQYYSRSLQGTPGPQQCRYRRGNCEMGPNR